ncbi:helix-turn-helix transcriptional regulator [Leptolyngbya cf. ectocarpi LEGE 11479]|uniref:Helix-turn-helix transcriptional regulator n=1 Tax=Leptolyngbya cf. ectocarpi LEGE 11479 TaxID=1828722 RepID=A0A928ZWP2_LEPEC|nr:helix-turn-helix transcriptional regulator [Leptolyngbya ectocarpi]MBE9068854.1 helix-turn-helix transcriptional regulator [Leptolyngbya cf. ectocarpi LEGE 11479]
MPDSDKDQNFVKLRERASLTQRQVAEELGVTVTTISSWETGRKEPRLDFRQVEKLMELYSCSISDLADALDELRSAKNP